MWCRHLPFALLCLAFCTVARGGAPVIEDLSGYPGEGYSLSISLGTPPQKFKVILDTGSSNFALAAAPDKNITSYFNSKQSTTYQSTGRTASVSYTEGFWSGTLAQDQLRVSDVSPSILVYFVGIDSSKKFFQSAANWQGILGLGYPALAKPNKDTTPVFDEMVKQGAVTSDVFSMQLCGTIDKNHHQDISIGGKMVFDGVAPELYHGHIFYTPIVREWFYEVVLTDIAVQNKSLGMTCSEYNNPKTIVDSGTTTLRLPTKVYNTLLSEVKKFTSSKECAADSRFWGGAISCCWSTDDERYFALFPTISVSLAMAENSSQQFTLEIPPQIYLQAVNESTNSTKPLDCYKFSILPSNAGTVLGAVVMEGYYVIFDRATQRIGFAASTCQVRAPEFTKPVVRGPSLTKNTTSCKFESKSSHKLTTLAIVLIVISAILLFPVTYCIVILCCRSSPSDDQRSFSPSCSSSSSDEDHSMSRKLL